MEQRPSKTLYLHFLRVFSRLRLKYHRTDTTESSLKVLTLESGIDVAPGINVPEVPLRLFRTLEICSYTLKLSSKNLLVSLFLKNKCKR